MSFTGDIPCWIPDIPITRDDEWRLRVAAFGDGYAQRTLDGINARNLKWSLTWEMREQSVLQDMVNYLVFQKANAFQFKEPPTGTIHNVFCDTWHIEWVLRRWNRSNPLAPVPLYWGTLSAEFVKANGVTA